MEKEVPFWICDKYEWTSHNGTLYSVSDSVEDLAKKLQADMNMPFDELLVSHNQQFESRYHLTDNITPQIFLSVVRFNFCSHCNRTEKDLNSSIYCTGHHCSAMACFSCVQPNWQQWMCNYCKVQKDLVEPSCE